MKYKMDRYADYEDNELDNEYRDSKRQRRDKRGKRDRDSLEGRDRKWNDWE